MRMGNDTTTASFDLDDLAARLIDIPWRNVTAIAAQALSAAPNEDALSDGRRLVTQTLDCSSLDLLMHPERRISAIQARKLADALQRRITGEPVSRIAGHRGFYGRDFLISTATLDPRPESETLIDAALARFKKPGTGLTILDVGTGSGCLVLTLLTEYPEARGVGLDPSPAALRVAQANAEHLGVADRVTWIEGRIENIALDQIQRFPLIVSNPPYIPTADIDLLDPDVRNFDPHLALDGGADGLTIYRALAHELDRLSATGWIILEVGDGQATDVAQIVRTSSICTRITGIQTLLDMAGKQRCVAIKTL
jgi:release factor glutamine methyltransferase